jgi:hypothetical protein
MVRSWYSFEVFQFGMVGFNCEVRSVLISDFLSTCKLVQ